MLALKRGVRFIDIATAAQLKMSIKVGGFFFNKLGSSIANPNGFQVGTEAFKSVYGNFSPMLKRLSLVYLTIQVGSWALLMKEPKEGEVAVPSNPPPTWAVHGVLKASLTHRAF